MFKPSKNLFYLNLALKLYTNLFFMDPNQNTNVALNFAADKSAMSFYSLVLQRVLHSYSSIMPKTWLHQKLSHLLILSCITIYSPMNIFIKVLLWLTFQPLWCLTCLATLWSSLLSVNPISFMTNQRVVLETLLTVVLEEGFEVDGGITTVTVTTIILVATVTITTIITSKILISMGSIVVVFPIIISGLIIAKPNAS